MVLATEKEPIDEGSLLVRTCQLCEQAVGSHVWYARTLDTEPRKRAYACPACYFDLDEEDRAPYYRERV